MKNRTFQRLFPLLRMGSILLAAVLFCAALIGVNAQLTVGTNEERNLATYLGLALTAVVTYLLQDVPKMLVGRHFGWKLVRYKMSFEDGVALYGKYVGNWGGEATRWRFDAVQDGNVVRSVTLCPSAKLHLEVKVSRTALREKDTYDMAAVRVRILDENGTPAPYAQFPVQFAVEGSAALVGPQTAVAEGGMTGTYLRTVGAAGEAVLTVSAPQTQPVVLRFTIEKEDAVWN